MAFHADWLPSPTPQFRSSFEKQQLAFAVETSAGKAAAEGGAGLVVFPDATPKGRPLSDSSGGSLEDPTGKAAPSTLSETLGAVAHPNGDRRGFQAQRPCSGRLPGLGSCAPRPPRAPGQWPTSRETRLAETCLLAPSGPGGGAFQTPATAPVSLLVSPFGHANFCFTWFEALLLGADSLRGGRSVETTPRPPSDNRGAGSGRSFKRCPLLS